MTNDLLGSLRNVFPNARVVSNTKIYVHLYRHKLFLAIRFCILHSIQKEYQQVRILVQLVKTENGIKFDFSRLSNQTILPLEGSLEICKNMVLKPQKSQIDDKYN